MGGDKVVEAVMSQQNRIDMMSAEFKMLCDRYQCTPQICEVRRGGQTVQIGIEWVLNENIAGSKPGKIIPFGG